MQAPPKVRQQAMLFRPPAFSKPSTPSPHLQPLALQGSRLHITNYARIFNITTSM